MPVKMTKQIELKYKNMKIRPVYGSD